MELLSHDLWSYLNAFLSFKDLIKIGKSCHLLQDLVCSRLCWSFNPTPSKISTSVVTLARLKAWLSMVKPTLKLRSLDLTYSFVNNDGLALIASLTDLKFLSLSDSSVHIIVDTAMTTFAALTNLTNLNLSSLPRISNKGFQFLSHLVNLKSLDLVENPLISAEGLSFLKNLPHLTRLNLKGCSSIGSKETACLGTWTNLKNLNLGLCHCLDDPSLQNLTSLINLTELNIGGCSTITDNGLAHLRHLKQIQSLKISSCKNISDSGLLYLGILQNLHFLNVQRCPLVTIIGLQTLPQLSSILASKDLKRVFLQSRLPTKTFIVPEEISLSFQKPKRQTNKKERAKPPRTRATPSGIPKGAPRIPYFSSNPVPNPFSIPSPDGFRFSEAEPTGFAFSSLAPSSPSSPSGSSPQQNPPTGFSFSFSPIPKSPPKDGGFEFSLTESQELIFSPLGSTESLKEGLPKESK